MKAGLTVFFLLLFCNCIFAQVDNTYISDDENVNRHYAKSWGIGFNNFNYFRNTEYFNQIESGQTLFGNQLTPALWLQPDSNLKIKAGVFFNHAFGSNSIHPILPVFSFIYGFKQHQFIFGTLNGATSHALLEPIFNINNAIEQRIEQGAEYTLKTNRTFMDVWINWQKYMPYAGNEHERFVSGLNFKTCLVEANNGAKIYWNNQLIASHKGGQLSKDTTPQNTSLQAAAGLEVCKLPVHQHFDLALSTFGFLSVSDSANQNNAYALMTNLTLGGNKKLNPLAFTLTYFAGNNFYANNGTYIYQNISHDTGLPVYNNRALLFFRIIFQNKLNFANNGAFSFSARFEPFYDFNSRLFEYSYSLYLVYHMQTKIGKLF